MSSVARSFYARLVTAIGDAPDPAILGAFEEVDRAAFVGPGPWKIYTAAGYIDTPNADEAFIYQDVLVGLAPERRINNGQPSLHARCLAAANPRPGDRVLHVGAGTGYYSAILARLVGPEGHVDAYEIEPDLAATAAANLAGLAWVKLHAASALEGALPVADVIYVNAGASHPPACWLDALRPGGRLLFPLTAESGNGMMMLVTRTAEQAYAARVVCGAMFIPCIGARGEDESAALMQAMSKGGHMAVRSLQRTGQGAGEPDETAWLSGDGRWFSRRPA